MYTTEFVDIPLNELLYRVQSLKHQGFRFIQMCAETTEAGIDLLYTFYDETVDNAYNLCVYGIDDQSEVPSIQGLYFAAFSYENEAHDLFGVHFANMELDFGGHFFNVAEESPMTIITPEMKAEREKLAKQKAAAAKARKAAEAKQAAEAEAAADAKEAAVAAGKSAGAVADKADPVAAVADAAAKEAERAAKMEEKLAAMDPEKAAKVRAALAAKAAKSAQKDGE